MSLELENPQCRVTRFQPSCCSLTLALALRPHQCNHWAPRRPSGTVAWCCSCLWLFSIIACENSLVTSCTLLPDSSVKGDCFPHLPRFWGYSDEKGCLCLFRGLCYGFSKWMDEWVSRSCITKSKSMNILRSRIVFYIHCINIPVGNSLGVVSLMLLNSCFLKRLVIQWILKNGLV